MCFKSDYVRKTVFYHILIDLMSKSMSLLMLNCY